MALYFRTFKIRKSRVILPNEDVLLNGDWLAKCDPKIWTIEQHSRPEVHTCRAPPVIMYHGDGLVRERYFCERYSETNNVDIARELTRKKFPHLDGLKFDGLNLKDLDALYGMRHKMETVRRKNHPIFESYI